MNYLQFLFTLRKLVRTGWKARTYGSAIRLAEPKASPKATVYHVFCPFTAACLRTAGISCSIDEWKQAAVLLYFNSKTVPASAVVDAADSDRPIAGKVEHQIRSHLLYFLKLPKEGTHPCCI